MWCTLSNLNRVLFKLCTTFFMLFRINRKNITVISYNLILKSILNQSKPWKNVDDVTVTWLNYVSELINERRVSMVTSQIKLFIVFNKLKRKNLTFYIFTLSICSYIVLWNQCDLRQGCILRPCLQVRLITRFIF